MRVMSSRMARLGLAIPALLAVMHLMQVGVKPNVYQPSSYKSINKREHDKVKRSIREKTIPDLSLQKNEQHEQSDTDKALQIPASKQEAKTTVKKSSTIKTLPEDKWLDQSKTVKALEKAVSAALTPEEQRLWYSTPTFAETVEKVSEKCPKPVKFKKRRTLQETDFTVAQQETLRKQLLKGSATIREAFLPWIEKGGFHPDLILHSIDAMGLMIGIFNGKVYFEGTSDLKSNPKVKLLAEHLESVMDEFRKKKVTIPDIMFPYVVASFPSTKHTTRCAKYSLVPEHLQDRYDTVPAAGIAMDPAVHSGIALMPNMYFANIRVWQKYTKQLLVGGRADTPWNKRLKKVFWRGKVGSKPMSNLPRMAALQAAARSAKNKSRWLDVKLTAGCSDFKEHAKSINQTRPDSPPWMPPSQFMRRTKCGHSNRVPHAKFSNYMAQLNLPGSTMGSYSKNLQNLWPTGAAVMIWDQAAVEFYYDTLKPGITHVWANETTVEPLAEKLFENNGELARLMGSVGREWFSKHLTMEAILDYYKQWFHAWAALQRFTPTPDMIPGACTCAGWSDLKKNTDGFHRCSWCANYPKHIRRGCLSMMGLGVKPSICF
jgi:hypothetical protein